MSTSWTLTASQICQEAFEHLAVYGTGETVSSADQVKALRALDALLKELPLAGYEWPKLSSETALTWSSGTPQTIALPADYFNYATVWKTVSGEKKQLTQIPHAQWVGMTGRTATAAQPTHFYIDPSKTLYFWPIPTADPSAVLQYQKIIDDTVSNAAPNVLQIWLNPLGWGVADEMSMDFGLGDAARAEIHQRWMGKKKLALEGSVSYEPICFSVAD